MCSNDILRANEKERDRGQNRKKERKPVSVCSSRTVRSIRSHARFFFFPPLCSPSSRNPGLPSFKLVSHSETQYQSRYEAEKHRIVFPQTIVSTAFICVMVSNGVSRPICEPPVCCLSIRLKITELPPPPNKRQSLGSICQSTHASKLLSVRVALMTLSLVTIQYRYLRFGYM